MSSTIKKFLISVLVIFVAVDLGFVIYFFYIAPNKKDFKTNSPEFIFSPGELKFSPGVEDEPSIGMMRIKGTIRSSIYFDKEIKMYILPLQFNYGKGLKLNVVVGEEEKIINILFAKKGIVPDELGGKAYILKNAISLFKKDRPIIIEYLYDSAENLRRVLNYKDCTEECQHIINEIIKYSNNTHLLKTKAVNKNNILIGPAHSFILYER